MYNFEKRKFILQIQSSKLKDLTFIKRYWKCRTAHSLLYSWWTFIFTTSKWKICNI